MCSIMCSINKLGIRENKEKVYYGGKLILHLLETGEYILGYSTDKVEGGPWTWVSRADPRVRSCINLIIMSADLAPYLKRILIDVEHKFAPARLRMVAGKKRLVYSDHYPVVVEFEKLPKGWIVKETTSSWNLNKPGGWQKYEQLTEAASEKISNVIENYELNTVEVSDRIEKMETKIKFQSFGKTKPPSKKKFVRRLEAMSMSARGMEAEDETANKLYKNKMKEIKDDLNKLKAEKHGTVTNVFKMAERIGGAKKQK